MMKKIREMVGAEVPIGLEGDPHCHLSARMVDNTTAIIASNQPIARSKQRCWNSH